jgi:hypothetical protein
LLEVQKSSKINLIKKSYSSFFFEEKKAFP